MTDNGDDQIRALLAEAQVHGDLRVRALCAEALMGHTSARAACLALIAEARARAEHEAKLDAEASDSDHMADSRLWGSDYD